MSAAEIIAAAKVAALQAARDQVAARAATHETQTREDQFDLAEAEQQIKTHHTAVALGSEVVPPAPDFSTIETLRAKVAIAGQVSIELKARLSAADQSLEKATRERNKAISDHIRHSVLDPARVELADAWDKVRAAIEKIMAAHVLAYQKFDDNARAASCVNDLYGPAAHCVSTLIASDWRQWPYSVKPDWLPWGGRIDNCNMPGVDERANQLRAKIEEELSA